MVDHSIAKAVCLGQDLFCLPEGFRRIGYDADTMHYTFMDKHGKLYWSAPGEEYSMLMLVAFSTLTDRPEAFSGSLSLYFPFHVDNYVHSHRWRKSEACQVYESHSKVDVQQLLASICDDVHHIVFRPSCTSAPA